jgi:hypothetical protein
MKQPISFFDEENQPKDKEDVRLKQLGLYVHEDGRRIAVGFNITPFRERPSLEVTATNERGEPAGSLTIIEALSPNFNLTMHLRDQEPTDRYQIHVLLYYGGAGEERLEVDSKETVIDVTEPGEHVID